MAKKRARLFETKFFAFVIAAFVIMLYIWVYSKTGIFQRLEDKILDSQFKLKNERQTKSLQEGAVLTENNLGISEDILIIGIDQKTLTEYGKWPFERIKHANLINAFSRLNEQGNRESGLFIDVFFNEPDPNPTQDAILSAAIKNSGKVYLETVLANGPTVDMQDPLFKRQKILYENLGTIKSIKGNWKTLLTYSAFDPPLEPMANAASGYGHANFNNDSDKIFRKQPLILGSTVLIDTLKLDDLTPGYSVNSADFERLLWIDNTGNPHDIDTPITNEALLKLKKEMKANAPLKVEDANADGVPDESYYIIRHYKNHFVPSITLALALNYFNKTLNDLEIVVGSYVLIKNPQVKDSQTGELIPYSIQTTNDEYDKDGNLVNEGNKRAVPEIRIPINENGQMLVNFMGPRSSEYAEGWHTFPVRSYSAYANRDPGSDPTKWKRTMAVNNKILMVGAFTPGMADDEKPTPLGMMYGIELHANALNTILMDNFLSKAPFIVNCMIFIAFILLISLVSSRLPAIAGFFMAIIGTLVQFIIVNIIAFEKFNYLMDFTPVAIGLVFTFVSIVVYRAFTEERDKKQIRAMFGKYLSPKVVDQLTNDPPELGGVDKELTVFFSDIRGFTSLSETMTPQELVNHLNVYFTAMTNLALDYGATLDKYMGDAIMCFWGAPIPQADHAVLACKCALRQIEVLKELNKTWPETKQINIGIGLNSGVVTVGNMGSNLRMNYTIMGDHVNLCSRLEATNKEYGTRIIISEFTYAMVKDKFIVRELDNIRVKGKNKPVVIYELVDCIESLDPPNFGLNKTTAKKQKI